MAVATEVLVAVEIITVRTGMIMIQAALLAGFQELETILHPIPMGMIILRFRVKSTLTCIQFSPPLWHLHFPFPFIRHLFNL